jgi:hypothetical protein
MEKQSEIVKALQAALDELELLVIEGENLDLDIVEGLQARFDKLKAAIEQKNKK